MKTETFDVLVANFAKTINELDELDEEILIYDKIDDFITQYAPHLYVEHDGLTIDPTLQLLQIHYLTNYILTSLLIDLSKREITDKNTNRAKLYTDLIIKYSEKTSNNINKIQDFEYIQKKTSWLLKFNKDVDDYMRRHPEILSSGSVSMMTVKYLVIKEKQNEYGYTNEQLEQLKLEAEKIEEEFLRGDD